MQINKQASELDNQWQRTEYRTEDVELLAVEYEIVGEGSAPKTVDTIAESVFHGMTVGSVVVSIVVGMGMGLALSFIAVAIA